MEYSLPMKLQLLQAIPSGIWQVTSPQSGSSGAKDGFSQVLKDSIS